MFQSHFPYSKINFQKRIISGHTYIEHNYSFRGKTGKRYLVILEEYKHWIYVVKFCLQEHKLCANRFNRLTKINECSKVVTTVGMIMKEVYHKNPYSSFGFIGSNLPNEAKNNTKRFKLYSKIIEQLISPVNFEHRKTLKFSAYLMINRENNEQNLLGKIEAMFLDIYAFE